MEKNKKTIKLVILIIILLLTFTVIFSIIYLNNSKNKLDDELLVENERIVLEHISYEIIDNNVYNIFDETDTYIVTVYSNEELQLYIDDPNYRPIFNDGDDDEQMELGETF